MNFFGYTKTFEDSSNKTANPAYTLKIVISKFYYILRNLALIGSLLVLLYCGIKILISSASKDKAKYKSIFIDWLIGLCILLFMHFIMVFMINIVENITTFISAYFSSLNISDFVNNIRNEAVIDDLSIGLGYTVMYLTLLVLVITYTYTYFKRIIYMAFLTIISPLVAFTYPIDKLNDGQAQAFNMWIKEYIFNLLIQPMHLIIYTVILGSVQELASSSMLYALVALAFISQAEKIVRRFFGFEKAQTPGLLNGPAGGALMMSAMHSLGRFAHGPRGPHGKNNSADSSGKKQRVEAGNESNKPHFSNQMDAIETLNNALPDSSNENNPTPSPDSGVENNNTSNEEFEEPRGNYDNLNGDAAVQLDDLTPTDLTPEDATTSDFTNTRTSYPMNTTSSSISSSSTAQPQKRRRLKGVGSVAKLGGKALLKRGGKAVRFTGRKATQLAAGAFVGGTLGLIGVASGIASGDPSKIFQNTAFAASTGYRLGKGTRDRIVNGVASRYEGVHGNGFRNIRDTYRKAALPKEEYQKQREKDYIDSYIKEHTKEFATMNNISAHQAREALLRDNLAEKCIRSGIEDIKDINNIYDIKQGNLNNITADMAIAATQLRNNYGINPSTMTNKTRKEFNDTGITDEMIDIINQVNTHKDTLG